MIALLFCLFLTQETDARIRAAMTANWDRLLRARAAQRHVPAVPKGAVEYHSDGLTQSIYTTDGFSNHHIDKVRIGALDPKWHQSGGMVGLTGWKSTKYRFIPEGQKVRTWIGEIPVSFKDSFGRTQFQYNRGLLREYPRGTEFHDVLSNEKGVVFEHRMRRKEMDDGKWSSEIIYADESARPKGYKGLQVSCSSCHGQAGTGAYGAGLIPGGDGVLSDPLDWSLVYGRRNDSVQFQTPMDGRSR